MTALAKGREAGGTRRQLEVRSEGLGGPETAWGEGLGVPGTARGERRGAEGQPGPAGPDSWGHLLGGDWAKLWGWARGEAQLDPGNEPWVLGSGRGYRCPCTLVYPVTAGSPAACLGHSRKEPALKYPTGITGCSPKSS